MLLLSSFQASILSFCGKRASFGAMSRTGAFIITGAGSGIGQAIAVKLAGQGHRVFGLGRSLEKLQATSRLLPSGRFEFLPTDLTDIKATHQAVTKIRAWLSSPLLGLVNNAGVFDRLAFHQTSDAIWERHFQNNLLSAVRLTRELYPELKAARPSSVLNVSSTLGVRPVAHTSAYSAIKAAMVNWTQSLALEWAADGIRVNCICPGLVDTPIHSFQNAEARAQADAAQPLGRMGRPEELAKAARFLASAASSFVTGVNLRVDGGMTLL